MPGARGRGRCSYAPDEPTTWSVHSDPQPRAGKAEPIVSQAGGHISHELHRCLEHPDRFLLLVRWQTLEDHTRGFRGSADYQRWKALLHHFYDPFPEVLHFENAESATTSPS